MSSKLSRVEAIPFSLPLRRASRWGRWGKRTAQDHVLVRVMDDDGVWGIAEATPRPSIYGESQASVVRAVEEHYVPIVEGADAYDTQGIATRMNAVPFNLTTRSAIDIAIHDLLARRAGVTLAELLGCVPGPVPLTYMLALRDPAETLEEAREVRGQYGIRSFKVKLAGDPSRDRAVLETLRSRGETDWTLTADANGLYPYEKAHALKDVLTDMAIALLEDPFPRSGLSDSRAESMLPAGVVADESMVDAGAAYRASALACISTICIKPPRTGIRESLAVSAIARGAGKTCWIGSQGVSDVGTLASAHVANVVHDSAVPADLGTFLRQADGADLLTDRIVVRDGAIELPAGAGSGAEIDPDKLDHFRVR